MNSVKNHNIKPFPVSKLVQFIFAIWLTSGLLPSTGSALAEQEESAPIFENVSIAPNFSPDPLRLRGISGGLEEAENIVNLPERANGPCVGFVDRQPDHILTLTSFFNFLKIEVESSQDTTIVISGPGGSWCNDDTDSENPKIAGEWQEGNYRIWVGSYEKNAYHPYTIEITQQKD